MLNMTSFKHHRKADWHSQMRAKMLLEWMALFSSARTSTFLTMTCVWWSSCLTCGWASAQTIPSLSRLPLSCARGCLLLVICLDVTCVCAEVRQRYLGIALFVSRITIFRHEQVHALCMKGFRHQSGFFMKYFPCIHAVLFRYCIKEGLLQHAYFHTHTHTHTHMKCALWKQNKNSAHIHGYVFTKLYSHNTTGTMCGEVDKVGVHARHDPHGMWLFAENQRQDTVHAGK